jgi:hypothetical protein
MGKESPPAFSTKRRQRKITRERACPLPVEDRGNVGSHFLVKGAGWGCVVGFSILKVEKPTGAEPCSKPWSVA